MKIATGRADAFVRQPDPAILAVLVYGPDTGLVRERAQAVAATVVEDLGDPFLTAEIEGDALYRDPARLADEAGQIPLAGGRRLVRVKGADNRLADAFQDYLADPAGEAMVVVEAGDLDGGSRLRKAFEKADNAAAVPCYRDEGPRLAQVIDEELGRHGLSADRRARALLAELLGGDRLLTRNEIAKLAVYKGEDGQVTEQDIEATIADSSELNHDRIARAVGAGDLAELERSLGRALAEHDSPSAILGAVRRHLQALHLLAGVVEQGAGLDDALRSSGLGRRHFRVVGALKAQQRRWPRDLAGRGLDALQEADGRIRSTGMPAEAVCRDVLFRLARGARAARR